MKKLSSKLNIKVLALILAVIFTASFAVACNHGENGSSQKTDNDNNKETAYTHDKAKENVDVNEVYDILIKTGNFAELNKVPESALMDGYGIDPATCKQWVMAFPLNYFENVNQIAIFEANDEQAAEAIKKALSSYLAQTKKTAEGYSDPAAAELVGEAEVVMVENFVYLVVGNNYDDLMKIMYDNIG